MNVYREAAAPYLVAQTVEAGSAAPSAPPADVELRQPAGLASTLPAVPADQVDRHRAHAALKALHRALETWEQDIDRLAADGDLYALADGYAALDEFLRAARDVRNHAEDHIARLMDQDRVNLDDEITLERHRGRKRREWDWDGLLKALGWDRWVDPESGEYVADTLKQVVSLTASVSPRVGALRDRGIQPDEFCDESPARTTVQVRSRKAD